MAYLLLMTLAAMQPCTFPNVARAAECRTVTVPENRAKPTGRSIDLNVVVLKAPAPGQADPILFFAGGPGQGAATLVAGLATEIDPLAPDRDIILIDQRGTGRSHPLTCDDGFLLVDPAQAPALRKCYETLRAGADLDSYGTDEAAEDAAQVVRVLGYTQVNVVAASYGTRLAIRFMQQYPRLVRTAVLRAVAPAGFNILGDAGRHASAALAQVLDDCRADTRCHAAFPDLAADLTRLRERLQAQPEPVSAGMLDTVIYALLLSAPTRQMIPWLIHAAAGGDMAALASTARAMDAIYKTVAVGQYLSIVCGEDLPYLRQRDKAPPTFDAGTGMVASACATWRVERAPQLTRTRLAQPTLIVSGALDPAMPPGVGQAALRDFTRGTHVVLPATAHGPMFAGCATDIARSFIASAGTDAFDRTCVQQLHLLPWRVQ